MSQLGPITTGLGEIFQYTLVSKDKKYDATELRTIQDYIVRPILRTVPGVTDVNSFGGLVKQYQVIVKPDRLTSLRHHACNKCSRRLEKNNANASGNFIEHESEQYVVRGLGLVKDTQDIENIIVAHAGAHAGLCARRGRREDRRGIAAGRGHGQWRRRSRAAGIVLMLKGASGRDVVNAVKEKLPAIQKALPKGVELVPFYDRTDLVKKAIHTVTKRLQEGAIFVLIMSDCPAGRCAQRHHRHAGAAAGRALRLHHDEMVWPERESHVARRSGHRHRHDGGWRGGDGGKHPSPSDRETATTQDSTLTRQR